MHFIFDESPCSSPSEENNIQRNLSSTQGFQIVKSADSTSLSGSSKSIALSLWPLVWVLSSTHLKEMSQKQEAILFGYSLWSSVWNVKENAINNNHILGWQFYKRQKQMQTILWSSNNATCLGGGHRDKSPDLQNMWGGGKVPFVHRGLWKWCSDLEALKVHHIFIVFLWHNGGGEVPPTLTRSAVPPSGQSPGPPMLRRCMCIYRGSGRLRKVTHTILTDLLWHWKQPILKSSGCKASIIIEENNQNKQGGRKLKTVHYCLQYSILFYSILCNGHEHINVSLISWRENFNTFTPEHFLLGKNKWNISSWKCIEFDKKIYTYGKK